MVWAGILSGTQWERCWRRWDNTNSLSETTCRHSNLHVTNKYLQATSKAKRLAQDKLVDAILPTGLLPAPKLIQ